MDSSAKEIMALIKLMAHNDHTMVNAEHYFDGLGANASMKERTIRFIDLLVQDGSAMGFEEYDDIGDIVSCMDDIAEYFHLLISYSWFSPGDTMAGWLSTLGERWEKNGVSLLCIEDPKHKVFPVYAAANEDVPAILRQAGRAGIAVMNARELDDMEDDGELTDFSELTQI